MVAGALLTAGLAVALGLLAVALGLLLAGVTRLAVFHRSAAVRGGLGRKTDARGARYRIGGKDLVS